MRETSNFDFDKLFKNHKEYLGAYAKDAIPKTIWNKRGFFIINQDDHTGPGTHWCYTRLGSPYNVYVDSFGFAPSTEVTNGLKRTKRKSYYSTVQIQSPNSSSCGWFSSALGIENGIKNRPIEDILMDDFGYHTNRNEHVLKQYFDKLGFH
jgi:hypothetical protein